MNWQRSHHVGQLGDFALGLQHPATRVEARDRWGGGGPADDIVLGYDCGGVLEAETSRRYPPRLVRKGFPSSRGNPSAIFSSECGSAAGEESVREQTVDAVRPLIIQLKRPNRGAFGESNSDDALTCIGFAVRSA